MITEPKKALKFLITLILIGLIGGFVFHKYMMKLYSNYPELTSETEINSKITNIRREHGAMLIKFSSDSKYSIYYTHEFMKDDINIFDFLNLNDSLIKMKDSDSVKIIRNNQETTFVKSHN